LTPFQKVHFTATVVSLPTVPEVKVGVYFLKIHQTNAPAPIGIRYLHLRKRLLDNPVASGELLTTEANA
jgi:hypothetical protein